MAGGVRDTEATFDVAVNGIGKLNELNEAFNKTVQTARKADEIFGKGFNVAGNLGGISRFNSGIEKATTASSRLQENLTKTMGLQRDLNSTSARMGSSLDKAVAAYDKQVISAEKVSQAQSRSSEMASRAATAEARHAEMVAKVSQAQSRASEYATKAASAQEKETAALAKSVAQADKLASARQKDLALAEKYNAQTNAINGAAARSMVSTSGEKNSSKVGGAVKEGLAMFAPSMLLASGVMQGAEYIKELFKKGAEYNSEQSGMQATWKTLVQGARDEGVSRRESGTSAGLVNGITTMARDNGRSLDLVNENYQQMYHATESSDRTKHLVQSELRIGDAMGMSDDAAKRFAMYGVGHALDRGKVTGGALNQMVQYAPAITSALARSVVASQKKIGLDKVSEKDVNAEKKNLRDDIKGGDVSAKMLENALNYLGDTKFKEAAKNAMSSIPGIVRSVKNGLPRLVGDFQNGFLTPLGKATSGFFGKMTKWINSDASDKWAKKLGTDLSGVTVKVTKFGFQMADSVGKMWKASAPFRTGFADGFVGEMKNIKNAVSDGAKWIGKEYDKLKSMLPKGSNSGIEQFGKNVGKVAAFMLALKGASKLPVIGKLFDGMLGKVGGLMGKIPVIGGLLEKIIGGAKKDTAGSQMLKASDTMMAAANKMMGAGGVGGSGGAGYTNGRVVSGTGKFTASEKLANSGFGAAVDKTFLKGTALSAKGGLSGLLGKLLVGGSTGAAKLSLGGAGLATAIGSSKIGSFLGGAGRLGKGVLSRGGGLINAAFAGFDVYNAMKNNKAGTTARHVGVGSAIGGGVGGTLGAALGSFLGPLGTIGGGMAGSWVGNKIGGWVGSKWPSSSKKKSTKKTPTFNKRTIGPSTSALGGSKAKNADNPLLNALNESKKKSKSTHKSINSDSKKSASSQKKDSASVLANAKKNNNALLAGSKKLNSAQAKLSKESASKIKKSAEAASKGQKKAAEAAAKASVAAQKKAAKSTLASMKKQGSDLQKALKKQSSGQKKELSSMKKNQSSALKSMNKSAQSSFKKFSKEVSNAMKKAQKSIKSGMKSMNSATKSGLKPIESQFKKLTSMVKSNLKKATNAAKSGSKSVVNAVKSGMKGVGNAGKSAFNKLPSSLKSGLNKAKSVAKSGAKGIVTSVRGGLKSMNGAAKSSMNGFTSSIKSSMSKATSAARSGSSKIVSTVKSGLAKVSSSATSSMSKLASSITSGMNKATSAAKSGADKMSTSLSNGFKKAVTAANSATSKIAASMNKIGSSASSATSKVQALANAINSLKSKTVTITANVKGKGADKLEHGTSGALSAFNSLVPHYANGTGAGHRGGMALVNDAKGSNYREAFMLPNGVIGLFPKKRNFLTVLPKGAHVLNAQDTKRKFGAGLSRYVNGTSHALQAVNAMQNRNLSSSSSKKGVKLPDVNVNITVNIQNAGDGAVKDITQNLKPAIKKMIDEYMRVELAKFEEQGA